MEKNGKEGLPPDRGKSNLHYESIVSMDCESGNGTGENSKQENDSDKYINNQTNINSADNCDKTDNRNIEKNFYSTGDSGPYFVFIENKTGNIGRLHRIGTARLILKAVPEIEKNITNIASVGKNKVKVECNSLESANILVKSKVLREKQYDAYIPTYYTEKRGVIRQVDTDITETELKSIITGRYGNQIKIVNVKRMFRKVEDKLIPTGTIVVSFKGQRIPDQVVIERMVYDVDKYIPRVVQCLNCLRYGHISKQCKSKIRCQFCGEEHEKEVCPTQQNPQCILCGGAHPATDKNNCPIFVEQKSVKTLMALENLTYVEAKSKYNSSYAGVVAGNDNHLSQNSRYTVQLKRKRSDYKNVTINPYSPEHREILQAPKSSSQPVFNTNRNIPQYHNINKNNIQDNSLNIIQNSQSSNDNTCELIINVIKKLLETDDIDLLNKIKNNISPILNNIHF